MMTPTCCLSVTTWLQLANFIITLFSVCNISIISPQITPLFLFPYNFSFEQAVSHLEKHFSFSGELVKVLNIFGFHFYSLPPPRILFPFSCISCNAELVVFPFILLEINYSVRGFIVHKIELVSVNKTPYKDLPHFHSVN